MPRNFIFFIGLFFTGLFVRQDANAAQPDYVLDEQPHPSTAEDIKGPLTTSFLRRVLRKPLFPRLKATLDTLPPFFRDTSFSTNFRTFGFDRDNSGIFDPDGSNDNKAWAIGGSLNIQSGFLAERFAVGASYYTSQHITGPDSEDGSLLLAPGQEGFNVFGQAYALVKLTDEIEFRGYRQSFNLPYLNRQDSRMVPNTHEAYVMMGREAIPDTDFIAGYVSKMKTRNSDKFIHMSEVAGITGGDDGLFMLGARYKINEQINVGAINYHSLNFMNILYVEANALFNLSNNIPIHMSAQFTKQHSIGDELTGDFSTSTGGVKASISYRGLVITAAGTVTKNSNGIRSPFGGRPSYLSIIVKDFDRAGEDAWLIGLAYDFSFLGIEGLSAYTNYAKGTTPDTGNTTSPDQREWDITVDYKPKANLLKGLWIRYRRADVNQDGSGGIDLVDNRLILNWEIPLL